MTGSISPEDRALIEHTRKVNKTLSLFVFAVQERGNIPVDGQVGIADMLVGLADTIRARVSNQPADSDGDTAQRAIKNDGARLLLDGAVVRVQAEGPRDWPMSR